MSQRYEEILEVEPIELRSQADTNRQSSNEVINPFINLSGDYNVPASTQINAYIEHVFELYEALLKAGVARECARFILPECTSTTILMTGTLRSWIHFLDLRDDDRAQKEAQLIAKDIKKLLMEEVPGMFTEKKEEQ